MFALHNPMSIFVGIGSGVSSIVNKLERSDIIYILL